MNKSLFLAAVMATSGWAAATYNFTSSNFATITNFTTCTTGPCANYTSAMKISGSFTVATALGPNFSGATDISSQVTAYSFSDGLVTYTNTDANARLYQFNVATDASGNISVASLLIERWQSGTSPHSVGDRVALVNLNGPSINQGENNLRCLTVGGGTGSGVSDLCVTATSDAGSSVASTTSGTWASPVTSGPVPSPTPAPPTLLLMLTGLAGASLYLAVRKRVRS
jgi:hypothetical protein